VLWKFGRRSSGGIVGGTTTDAVERKVLVDVWLTERFKGRLINAPGYADKSACDSMVSDEKYYQHVHI